MINMPNLVAIIDYTCVGSGTAFFEDLVEDQAMVFFGHGNS